MTGKREIWKIVYLFEREGEKKEFSQFFDSKTFRIASPFPSPLPEWAKLENYQCGICPLKPEKFPYCPPAAYISPIVEFFCHRSSFEKALWTVETPFRTYQKRASLQEGMSSLIGLYMASSGCPILDKLRPLAFIHLPFASLEETVFRMAAVHMLAQYYRHRRGKSAFWSLEGLQKIAEEVSQVNRDFIRRLASISKKDASLNALVRLDCFTLNIRQSLERAIGQLEPLFSAYWEDE